MALGVFPTDEAQNFAPVEFDSQGKVLNIGEKPAIPEYSNAWGIAVWAEKFWDYFKNSSNCLEPGVSITDTFDKASKAALVFTACFLKTAGIKMWAE